MGSVYSAYQMSIDRTVAVKLLAPKFVEDHVFVERFLREARAAARLNHPNIVQAIDVGESDGHYYFAMEYVEGATLRALLKERGRIPPAEACEIVIQVARALEHAGRHNMLHLDVKPANIMLTSTGLAKLGDFGLARHVEDEDTIRTQKKVIFGTPGYMPPEQVRGVADLDKRSDIYSLGVTFYELVTGRNPFAGSSIKETLQNVLASKVTPAHEAEPSVPPDMSLVIAKIMAYDRDDRYADPAQLLVDLDALSRLQPPPIVHNIAPPQPKPVPKRMRSKERALLVAVIGGAVVLLTAVFLPLLLSHFRPVPANGPDEPSEAVPEQDPLPAPTSALFRQCVIEAEQAMEEDRFAEALTLYDDFAATHKGTRLGREDARYAADDVRNRAVERARELSKEIQSSVERNDYTSARERCDHIVSFGLPETQRIAEAARRRLQHAEEVAARRAEAERERAIRAAHSALEQQLNALARESRFSEAIARCEAFLANADYASVHAPVRTSLTRLRALQQIQSAILAGVRDVPGYALQEKPKGADVIGVRDGKILIRHRGSEQTLGLSELSPTDLIALASRGREDVSRLLPAVALLLREQERYEEALRVVSAARERPSDNLPPYLEDVECESLLGAARRELDAAQPRQALKYLQQLKREHGRSGFYQHRLRELRAIASDASKLITVDMKRVSGGQFLFQDKRRHLPLFYIDTHEVTNAEYAEFLEHLVTTGDRSFDHPAQPQSKQDHMPLDWEELSRNRPRHPVVGVDWYDAFAYARWRGKRLADEMGWEKAARGRNGRKYPWGNEWKDGMCNAPPIVAGSPADLPTGLKPVGSYPQADSPYGCTDMAGNAREWVVGAEGKWSEYVPVRGGAYRDSAVACSTTQRLLMPRLTRDRATGFRCAMDPIEDL